MTRNAVTQRYLDEMTRRGIGADELPAAARASDEVAVSIYAGRSLTRPAFLDRRERETLETDLGHLYSALAALPDRLFGGDLGAFATAAGFAEAQAVAISHGQGQRPTSLGRADLYHDGAAFRLMELNMGSTAGGMDNAMLNRALLTHPALADFVAANKLSYVDSLVELVALMRADWGVEDGARPFVAAVDWPASFEKIAPMLRNSAAALTALGIETVACHLGQLEYRGGRVWLDGRPVDAIYRVFLIEDLLDPEGPALIEPVLRAVAGGEVKIFTPMHDELYGSKAALAMLSDEANRHLYADAELTSLDRLLPWTRMVRDGSVTVDGERVGLREYALERREDLVLKPTLMHGGLGVVLGWKVDADEWRRSLLAAMDGPYVVQKRIRAAPEQFPAAGGLVPMLLKWNVFIINGYGGTLVSGSTDLSGDIVTSLRGAVLGCCFHEEG